MISSTSKSTASSSSYSSSSSSSSSSVLLRPLVDLEDTTGGLPAATAARPHRLPVFVNLQHDTPLPSPSFASAPATSELASGRRTSPAKRTSRARSRLDAAATSTTVSGTAGFFPARLCRGQCDGVTCMISTVSVSRAPCLRLDEFREDPMTRIDPDVPTHPIVDQLCPFHHLTSKWLVHHASNLMLMCTLLLFHNEKLILLSPQQGSLVKTLEHPRHFCFLILPPSLPLSLAHSLSLTHPLTYLLTLPPFSFLPSFEIDFNLELTWFFWDS